MKFNIIFFYNTILVMYNIIKDPKSKKFVPINSKKGQRILKNYIQFVESNEQFGGDFFGNMMKIVDKIRNKKKKKKKKKDNTDKEARSLLGSLGSKIKGIPGKIKELAEKILHIEKTITENNKNRAVADEESEKELNQIKKKIEENKIADEESEKELDQIKKKIEELKSLPNEDNSKEIDELENKLDEKTAEVKKKHEIYTKEIDELENKLSKKTEEVKKKHENNNQIISSLQEQNQKLEKKISDLEILVKENSKNKKNDLDPELFRNLSSSLKEYTEVERKSRNVDKMLNKESPYEDYSDSDSSDDYETVYNQKAGDEDDDEIRKGLYKNEDELSGLSKMIDSL